MLTFLLVDLYEVGREENDYVAEVNSNYKATEHLVSLFFTHPLQLDKPHRLSLRASVIRLPTTTRKARSLKSVR
jgi:hypothetical protein